MPLFGAHFLACQVREEVLPSTKAKYLHCAFVFFVPRRQQNDPISKIASFFIWTWLRELWLGHHHFHRLGDHRLEDHPL